jgi:hypothetical protein
MNSSNYSEKIIINKSFELIEKIGWERFSFQKLSEKEKIPLNFLKTNYKCKYTVIEKFSQMIDRQVESNIRADDLMDSSIKDKLFELIMLRFDELESFKKALKNIFLSTKKNPLLISIISKNLLNSFDFYLEVSNSYQNSPTDIFKKNFLLLIYSLVFETWLNDNSEDLSKTMSQLDKYLSIAEQTQNKINNFFAI